MKSETQKGLRDAARRIREIAGLISADNRQWAEDELRKIVVDLRAIADAEES